MRRRPKKDCSMKIETRALAALIPYINNARTHSDAQVAQIAASIREFGWTNPVLVDGENGIIAGHGRLMAARKLGMESVPVIELAHMTPAQKRAYILADNKLTLNGGWDDGLLLVELGELGDAGFDLELTGFTLDEINDLMAGDEPPGDVVSDAQPEDDAPSLVAVGDVWVLGRHRLMCGDSSSVTDIDALLGGREPDLLIYDPPYEVEAAWTWQYPAAKALVFSDYKHMPEAMRVASAWPHVYQFIWDNCTSWYTPNRPLARHKTALFCSEAPSWDFDAAVYRDGKERQAKTVSNTRGDSDYVPLADGFVHLQTVYQEPNTKQDSSHAHAKPVKWLNALMRGAGGSVALDLFGGSGATIIAAPESMAVYCMEIDPRSCDRIISRWQQSTGGVAEKATPSS